MGQDIESESLNDGGTKLISDPVAAAVVADGISNPNSKYAGGVHVWNKKTSGSTTNETTDNTTNEDNKYRVKSVEEAVGKATAQAEAVAARLAGKTSPATTLATLLKPSVTETVKTSQKRQGDLKNQKTLGLIGDALRVVTDVGTAAGGGNVILHTPFDAAKKAKEIRDEEDKETTTKTSFANAIAQARFKDDTGKMDLFKLILPNYLEKTGTKTKLDGEKEKKKTGYENSNGTVKPNTGSSGGKTAPTRYLLENGGDFTISSGKARAVSEAVLNSILRNPELRAQAIKTAGADLQHAFTVLLADGQEPTAENIAQAMIATNALNSNTWKEALKSVSPEDLAYINAAYWDKDKAATKYVMNHRNIEEGDQWTILETPVGGSWVGKKPVFTARETE